MPLRQLRQVDLLGRWRIVFLLVKTHVVHLQQDVLYHHVFVALELGIRRQLRLIYFHHLLSVDLDDGLFAALVALTGFAPFLLRRVVSWRLGRIGFDLGLPCSPFSRLFPSRKR
jgi:hypothetical protein